MIDFIISKSSIAIIWNIPGQKWKIAFGDDKKKIFNDVFETPDLAIRRAKKMGFGGYRLFTKNTSFRLRQTKLRLGINTILSKSVEWKINPIMFSDHKNWMKLYSKKGANRL